MTTLAILLALLLMAIQRVRETARQKVCANNLRQIGLAVHEQRSVHGHFFPKNEPLSWLVHLMPQLELTPTYNQFHHEVDAYVEPNYSLGKIQLAPFLCPSGEARRTTNDWVCSHYAANIEIVRTHVAHDGESQTIACFEVDGELGLPWITGPVLFPGTNSSHHIEVFNVLFVDGHVRPISASITPDVLEAIRTPNGGDVVGDKY